MSARIPSPQHGAVLALLELVTEHPELPTVHWDVSLSGSLSGCLFDLPDVEAVLARFMEVLDGTTLPFAHLNSDGSVWSSVQMFATWRDVRVSVTLGSVPQPVLVPSPSAVVLGREVSA